MASNVKHPKQNGKWWRKQPTSGKHQNRKVYRTVGHVNPHADTGPSRLLQALFGKAFWVHPRLPDIFLSHDIGTPAELAKRVELYNGR